MTKRTFVLMMLASVLFAGCNMPGNQAETTEMSVTQAYETVQARLSETALNAQSNTPTVTATLSTQVSPTVFSTPTISVTPGATVAIATATPRVACDQAAAGNPIDVTIPDDTVLQPSVSFTKVWRLQNVGSCTWNRSYAVAFFSGDQMGAPAVVPLAGDVQPGQSVDISVDMVAPAAAGKYQGNWKLRNTSNVLFGIGPGAAAPFWVRIIVAQTSTPTTTPRTPTATTSATATPTATSPAHIVGTASLNVNATIDFDTDQINVAGSDIGYTADSSGKHQLAPLGGALLGNYGNSQPGLSNCQASALSNTAIIVEDTPIGTYLCFRTDEGRYGRARLSNFNSGNFTVTLEFLTWP